PLDWNKFSNLPKVLTYLKEMNDKIFSPNDCLTIGEVGGQASIDSAVSYAGFDSNQLSMVFNFDHDWCNNLFEIEDIKDLKTNVLDLRNVLIKWQEGFKDKGWLPLNWLNHDQPRLMSHYGNLKYFKQSGKMLATLMYMLRGTPFIYQGEEIGMTNYPFTDVKQFNDISSINYYKYLTEEIHLDPKIAINRTALKSRDNARTPMQWNDSKNAGFSNVKPYMDVNPNYKDINVFDQMQDTDSIWYHYKKLFKLRKDSKYHEVINYGDIKFINTDCANLIIYERFDLNHRLLIINSFSNKEVIYELSSYIIKLIVLANDEVRLLNQKIYMNPYGSVILEVEENK
ncbi:MAG: alpha-amylase family glycosyl hydrolase, partial [Acholeplasmataceae bacterium]